MELDTFVNPPKLELVWWAATEEGKTALSWCSGISEYLYEENSFYNEKGTLSDWLVKEMQKAGIIGERVQVNKEAKQRCPWVPDVFGYPILIHSYEEKYEKTHVLVDK